MRETEVKGVAIDSAAMRNALAHANAVPGFAGTLVDRRYDTPGYDLQQRDEVLRIRITDDGHIRQARLDYKGKATFAGGLKTREEIGVGVDDDATLDRMLAHLGFVVTREIERVVDVHTLPGATVRFERYPRMDELVEVEGEPGAIESAIAVLGVARESFTSERLADFVRRYELRTGQRAALCARELRGDYRFRIDDA